MHNAHPSQLLSTLSFEIGSFNEPGVHQSPVLGVETCTTTVPSFYLGARELNSGSHICMVSAVLTEPSPQPVIFFLCKVTEQFSCMNSVDDNAVTQYQKYEHTEEKRCPRNNLGNI